MAIVAIGRLVRAGGGVGDEGVGLGRAKKPSEAQSIPAEPGWAVPPLNWLTRVQALTPTSTSPTVTAANHRRRSVMPRW